MQQGEPKARSAADVSTELAPVAAAVVRAIRQHLQRKIAGVANLYSDESLDSMRPWLATVPLTGTVSDARAKIRAHLRSYGSDQEISDLCEDLAMSLRQLEERQRNGAA